MIQTRPAEECELDIVAQAIRSADHIKRTVLQLSASSSQLTA